MADTRAFLAPEDAIGLLRSITSHRAHVSAALAVVQHELQQRATLHDLSKLFADEFDGFARINAATRLHAYGSPEANAAVEAERGSVDLHKRRNRHHPEHAQLVGEHAETLRGLPDDYTYWSAKAPADMTFLDVIEMVCDWWAAHRAYRLEPENMNTSETMRRFWMLSVDSNLEKKAKHLTPERVWLARSVAEFLAQRMTPTLTHP